ncbi:hypothetical protein GH714_022878 [Hevea brasiliensis]|uniref:UspA domain-containing protein n=1 Tax=Hevea brasiliensis TaxID=3981 RepID=A0A6A6KS21_HEVBR|nr:hypothetical protein GH714_022878 [Hevea brasiliensis]
MKMRELGQEDMMVSGGRTVMVGVKLDSQSRELLTWAMVKVAQPGDTVIALHVLGNNGTEDDRRNGLLNVIQRSISLKSSGDNGCDDKSLALVPVPKVEALPVQFLL